MITEKPVLSGEEQVLRQIEERAEKEFLPIVGPHKGKFWLRKFGRLSRGMFWRLAL